MLLESYAAAWQQANAAWNKNLRENRRVILLHALPALALPILVTVINLLLEMQLADTGGLSGIGLRSTLETIQTVLSGAIRILLPFWQLGLIFNAMQICRGQTAQPRNLLEGFSRWGAALRLMLLRTLRYASNILIGCFMGSMLYSLTPMSNNMTKVITQISTDPAFAEVTAEELMDVLISQLSFWDVALSYVLCIAGAAVLTIPLFYRYRMSNYALLDSEKPGAYQALRQSMVMMQGNRIGLFKLDLHFWWYYLLLFLATAASYGDLILPALGIHLPFSEEWAFIIFAIFSAALQFVLYYLFCGQVETTYACIYESLKVPEGGNETL